MGGAGHLFPRANPLELGSVLFNLKYFSVVAAFAFMAVCPVMAFASDSKADALVETALEAKRAGKLDAAVATLETALELQPDHNGALLALGRTYGAKQDYAKARRYLQKLLRVAPKSVDGHRFLALTWLREGRVKEALESAQKAKEIAPKKWQTYELLTQIHIQSGDVGAAIKSEKMVVKYNPKGVEGHLGLALLYRAKKAYGKAERHLRKAIKIAPKDLGPLMTLAGVKAEQGEVDASKTLLRKAEKLAKSSLRALETVGQAYMVIGDGKAAMRIYKRALSIDDSSLGALVALANLNLLNGDTKKAQSLSTKAMKLEPRLPEPYKVQALIAASKKEFDKSEAILKKGIKAAPANAQLDLRGVLAQLYANQKKLNKAITQFEVILKQAPKAQGVRTPLCQLYRQQKVKSGKTVCLEACEEVGISRKDCALP